MLRTLLRFFLATSFSLLFVASASAAVVTWDGGGADDNWGTCNNWSSNACPTSSDIATFDATSTDPVNIAVTLTGSTAPAGIDINTGYTGIITQNAGVSITVGGSNFDQAAGTFTGGDSAITVNGNFTVSAGVFTSTAGTLTVSGHFTHSGGTFTHSNGTVIFTGTNSNIDVNSTTVYNLTINATNSWTKTVADNDTLTVANTLTLTEGSLSQSTIPAAGTVIVNGSLSHGASFDGGTAQVNLESSATAAFSSGSMTGFKLNSASAVATGPSSGTVTFENHVVIANGTFNAGVGAITLSSGKNFTSSGGIFNGGAGTITFPNTVTISGGTFNAGTTTVFSCDSCTFTLSSGTLAMGSGTLNVSTNWTQTSGVFTEGTSTVAFIDGNGTKTADVNSTETFYNLIIGNSSTSSWNKAVADNDTLTVTNTLTLTDGSLIQTTIPGAGTVVVQGSISHSANFDGGTAQVNLESSGTASFVSGSMTGFKLNSASAVATGPSSGTVTFENHLEIADGTFNAGVGAITMSSGKNFTLSGGIFNGGAGTITFPNTVTISGGIFNAGTTTTFSCNSCTFTFSAGTLAMGSGTLNVATNWTQTSGVFTEGTSTVVFIDGNGTKTIDVNSTETFYNLTIGDSSSSSWTKAVANSDTLNVSNNLVLSNGIFSQTTIPSTGSVSVSKDVTVETGFDGGTAKLVFAGGSNQNFSLASAGLFNADIAVNKSGGEVDLLSALTMDASGQDLIIQEGTFDLSGFALSVTSSGTETIIIETGGNLQLQGGETITGDSASYPQLDSGSTVTYDGTVGPYTLKNYTYHHLTINGSGATFSPAANEVLGGNLTVTAGTFDVNDLTLAINGNTVINGGTMKSGTNTVTFGDAGGDSVTISSGGLEIESDAPGNDIVKNATTWTNSGGTITYNAATGIVGVVLSGLSPYFNLAINSSGSTYSLQANTDVDSSVTLTAGTLDVSGSNYNMTVGGSWTDTGAGTFTEGTGTVTFDGTGTINSNEAFENVTVAGTITLGAALDADATLIISSGSLDVSGSNFGITVGGGWTDTGAGTFTEGTGTVTFDGTGTINSNEAFENVTINSAGTVTLGAALDADGNLSITAGTLDVSGTNFGITVGGNWAKSGTFTQRSGTVTFDTAGTTSTISGSTTFNNFSCTTANKPITFTAGTTQTISGALTLTGSASNLIVLRSTVTDSAWNLTVNGTSSVDYVNVRDSNAGGGNAITHAVSPSRSVNVANNTNWGFNAAPTVASVTGVQASTGTANVTITFIMDDPDDDNTLQAKVEYSLDGGGSWNDPTLSTTNADTSATQGDPSINNAVTYQVGQSGAYILSSGGANTVTTVWVGATDLLTTINIANARIRITPYDGTVEGTAASSSNFILDRVAPTGLANFGHTDFSSTQVALSWTAATDTNFNHYEIWHGADESQVIARSGSAVEWDNDNDSALTTASTVRTTINNTDPRNKFFKIFAVDNYGNELTIATYYIGGGQSSGGSSSSSSSGSSSSGSGSSSTTSTDTTTDGGSQSGGGSSEEEPEEEVTEEEVEEEVAPEETEEEEESGTTWEDFDIQPEEGHWSEGYVKHLEEQTNIVEVAVSQPTFLEILLSILETPNESMPRGNALEFLLVLAGHSLDTMTINVRAIAFEDVSLDDDQAGFIQYAYEQRLVHGYPDGTFQPDRIVNRAEALKFCSYFFEGDWTHPVYGDELLELYELTENPFTDVDLNAWYAPYLINAYSKGVVQGYGDGTFGPGNDVTYAEFLKIAILMQNIEEAVELAEELE